MSEPRSVTVGGLWRCTDIDGIEIRMVHTCSDPANCRWAHVPGVEVEAG